MKSLGNYSGCLTGKRGGRYSGAATPPRNTCLPCSSQHGLSSYKFSMSPFFFKYSFPGGASQFGGEIGMSVVIGAGETRPNHHNHLNARSLGEAGRLTVGQGRGKF